MYLLPLRCCDPVDTTSSATEETQRISTDLLTSTTNVDQDSTTTDLVSSTPADQDVTNTDTVLITTSHAAAMTSASGTNVSPASQAATQEDKVTTVGADEATLQGAKESMSRRWDRQDSITLEAKLFQPRVSVTTVGADRTLQY